MTTVRVFAHRGASAVEPENTVAAFRRAADMGADGVELDVRLGPWREGRNRLLVHHDVDPRPGAPTLAEALDACAGMTVNIEIKNLQGDPDFDPDETLASEVVALLHERGRNDDVLVSSFNLSAINRVRRLDDAIATGFLVVVSPDDDLAGRVVERCRRHGHAALHPHHIGVTPRLVELCRMAGIAVNTWTVDDPERMRDLAALGVDGIITNVPDVARATLRG